MIDSRNLVTSYILLHSYRNVLFVASPISWPVPSLFVVRQARVKFLLSVSDNIV